MSSDLQHSASETVGAPGSEFREPKDEGVPSQGVNSYVQYNGNGTPSGASPDPDGGPAKSRCLPPRRRGTYVPVDFSDAEGVHNLHRTVSPLSDPPTPDSVDTNDTLTASKQLYLEQRLKRIVKKQDEAHIRRRELGVLFKDLRVTGLGSSAAFINTVWSTINPITIYRQVRLLRNPPLRNILQGIEGVVRPGEMLLVLGRPGSGCTTLLKVLANHRDEYHSVDGSVHYDSFSPEQIRKHYRGDVQYCPEDDYHFPTMTVKQTLEFAAKTRVPHARIEDSKGTYVKKMTEVLSTIFGLSHVQNTPVGDAAIRGLSGGEKKRVSIAEALATRSRIQSWDNSTRGLDSSTALEFGRALRIATDIDHQTTIVSAYQAGEPLYELFDKLCLLYEGRLAYYGPSDRARQYFIDMGYQPANRQTTPDFLVAVTDPNGRIPRPDFATMPRTPDEFAEYFLRSEMAQLNRGDMETYSQEFIGVPKLALAYGQSARAEHANHMSKKS
ncbi:hypothetical protein C0991_011261 [Blastosporella zonata]|nr:hypothetical protein C0991_011261 [Blastosporella zonata]